MLIAYTVSVLAFFNKYIGIFLAVIIITPLALAFWLWYFHDRHIKRLNTELVDIPEKVNKEFEGRGATTGGIEPHINARKRPIEAELKKKELNRQLFLDRASLISIFRIK